MFIREILTRKGQVVVTIDQDALVSEAIELLADSVIGAIAVSGDGLHVQGIISERDVIQGLRSQGEETLQMRVGDLMTQDVISCDAKSRIADVVEMLDQHHIRHMPVIDDEGNLEGIISIRDVVELRLRDLQEEVAILNHQLTKKV